MFAGFFVKQFILEKMENIPVFQINFMVHLVGKKNSIRACNFKLCCDACN